MRPSFARLLLDLGRFFRNARALLDDPDADDLTIGEYLERGGYGRELTDHFLAPMGAAIWSSSPARMREMPARFFIHFFDNHGLLGVRDAPQWYTIEGGSQTLRQRAHRRVCAAASRWARRCAASAATTRASRSRRATPLPSASTA